MITTTLKEIRKSKPCETGWNMLLKGLGKTKADDDVLKLETILKINDLADACWVANNVLKLDKELRLYAYWNAKQSKKYVDDKKKFNKVLNTVNLFAYGEVDDSAWASASDSAWASAWASASDSARDSARDSAMASAWASASDSARDSAWASAMASAMKKSEKAFVSIVCNGNLPKKVNTKNHF